METAGYLSSVTAVLPSSKTVLKPNTQDNIKLHSTPLPLYEPQKC